MVADFTKLTRPRHPIPDFVMAALEKRGLMDEYRQRPAYQQNDYIGWINSAKRQETKAKRLDQMLDELEAGGVYMNMAHPSSGKNRKGHSDLHVREAIDGHDARTRHWSAVGA